jgi:translation initiation factor IF-2
MRSMQPTPQKQGSMARPPIVVVVGHVDHGKTTLLDYIRKTRVADREAGGITQSVGAYEIERNGQRMTFIDTPGHEAFTKMRQRGAQFADIAILIVAADDGVKPQTKEAIEILQKEGTPFVVAINKIDKNNADPERTKQDLLRHNVLLEKYGGDVSWVEISAKEGTGIDELLDHVLLMWELEKPMYDPAAPAQGFVLESERDSRKGVVVSVVVTNGTLRTGDVIATKTASGKVRMLEDFLGKRAQELRPSSPAVILGFDVLPQAGEEFSAGTEVTALETEVLPKPEVRPDYSPAVPEKEENVVKLILKADVSGSAEALEQIIANTPVEGKTLRILSTEVGDIADNDIKNAETFGAYIIGFNVKPTKSAETYARTKNVTMLLSNIIYKLVEELQEKAAHQGEEVVLGKLEVLATFSQKNRKQVVGGKVTEGYFTLNERFTILRTNQELGGLEPVGKGKIINLQKGKNDVKKVEADEECGMFIESDVPAEKGDVLIVEQK